MQIQPPERPSGGFFMCVGTELGEAPWGRGTMVRRVAGVNWRPMAIVVLQHSAFDGPGILAQVLRDNAHRLDIRRLDLPAAQGGKPVPADYDGVSAVISLGGPQSVGDGSPWMAQELAFLKGAHERQLPVLGICLGHQLLAAALGGEVGPANEGEVGMCPVNIIGPGQTDTVLAGVPWRHHQLQAHNQEVTKVPPDAVVLASSPACRVQAFRCGLRTYGFQFHFEYDRAMIEARATDAFTQQLMARRGLSAADVRQQVDRHFDDYGRIGRRLAGNIASFLFPVIGKLRSA